MYLVISTFLDSVLPSSLQIMFGAAVSSFYPITVFPVLQGISKPPYLSLNPGADVIDSAEVETRLHGRNHFRFHGLDSLHAWNLS